MENRKYVYIDPYLYFWKESHGRYLDKNDFKTCRVTAFNDMELYNVTIDNDTINMYDVFSSTFRGLNDIQNLEIGPGVLMDIGYQMQESLYNFETQDPLLSNRRKEVENAKDRYVEERKKLTATDDIILPLISNYNVLNEIYLNELEAKVQSYREENNLNE